jgi:Uma2 family endonuclease
MIVSLQNPTFTLEEFLKRPETKPASEYINGQIYQKSMPQGKHSRLQTRLPNELNSIIEPPRLGCAFTELRCTFGGRSLVPDVSVFRWERIPLDDSGSLQNVFEIAPDWTIEILSPDQSPSRVMDNILFCLERGSVLGWLIDPEEELIFVYRPDRLPVTYEDATAVLPMLDILGDRELTVSELFGWLNFSR